MPIKTGIVDISNRLRDIFMKFNFSKISVSPIAMGKKINNIKGIVIKDMLAVIAVKETDNATFPSTNLVI